MATSRSWRPSQVLDGPRPARIEDIPELNDIFSDYDTDSELSRLNQTAGSGNNPGVNQFSVKLQGRVDSDHAWADLNMTPIAITSQPQKTVSMRSPPSRSRSM